MSLDDFIGALLQEEAEINALHKALLPTPPPSANLGIFNRENSTIKNNIHSRNPKDSSAHYDRHKVLILIVLLVRYATREGILSGIVISATTSIHIHRNLPLDILQNLQLPYYKPTLLLLQA